MEASTRRSYPGRPKYTHRDGRARTLTRPRRRYGRDWHRRECYRDDDDVVRTGPPRERVPDAEYRGPSRPAQRRQTARFLRRRYGSTSHFAESQAIHRCLASKCTPPGLREIPLTLIEWATGSLTTGSSPHRTRRLLSTRACSSSRKPSSSRWSASSPRTIRIYVIDHLVWPDETTAPDGEIHGRL